MSQERQECAAMAAAHAPPSLSPSCPVLQHHAAVYFGLSCALAVLHRAPSGVAGCDLGARQCRWSRARELALREKVGELEHDVEELRRRRTEDARANEKVAGIFAAHEQRWFAERNALRRQVHAVVAAARARKLRHDEATAELTQQLEEQRRAVGLKDDAMEQETKTHEEAEDKLRVSERAGEELRERARMDAQVHAAELRKHKAAFVELASAKQQLEAELKAALERRDEAAAELSAEAARLRQDAKHKDKILSAMLRKSKIDMEDREMLVREVKMCKARRKQAELEAERWRKMWESRGHRRGSRSSARCAAVDHPGCSDKLAPDTVACAHDTKIPFVDHVEAEGKKDRQAAAAKEPTTVESVDRYPSHVDDKPVVEEYQDLQEWFQMETEKYTTMISYQHSAEIEAFTEQLRLKDEKLEPFRWRVVSMDVEATRLRCRIQELEGRLSQYEQHSAGLEALLLDRENENRSLKEQLVTFQARAFHSEICPADDEGGNDTFEHCIPCSPVKIQKTESRGAERTTCTAQCSEGTEITNANHDHAENHADIKLTEPVSRDNRKNKAFDMEAIEAYDVSVLNDTSAAAPDKLIDQDQRPNVPTDHPYRSEIEQEKEVCTDPGNAHTQTSTTGSQEATSDVALAAPPEQKLSAWKMDIQALAVSYKIKRLKQQLLILEKLAAAGGKEATTAAKPSSNEASGGGGGSGSRQQPRSYQLMMSFLSKHVKRYKSLEDKIDDLCTRMEESKRSRGRERQSAGSREQSAALGQFLEETFQLQRYMVATGQKLLEMQSRIAPSLARGCGEADGVDMGRFMDVVGALLRDVQRGFEVRISRIIGDLEGTLTFHGILQTTL